MVWGLTGTKVPGLSLHRILGTMTVNKVSLWLGVGWGTVEGHLDLPLQYHRKFVSKCQRGPRGHHANKLHANRKVIQYFMRLLLAVSRDEIEQ